MLLLEGRVCLFCFYHNQCTDLRYRGRGRQRKGERTFPVVARSPVKGRLRHGNVGDRGTLVEQFGWRRFLFDMETGPRRVEAWKCPSSRSRL